MSLTQRLIDFYQRNSHHGNTDLNDTWNGIVNKYQGELRSALASGNVDACEKILKEPGKVMWGMENGEPLDLNDDRGKEMLSNLARRLGILPIFDPEQPSPTDNWKAKDFTQLRIDVEKIVGPLTVPNGFVFYGDPPGFPSHHMFRFAEWYTVSSFLGEIPKRILEIGAGTGSFGIVALRHSAQSYAVIDIPTSAVQSAFFIGNAIGEKDVHLFGEPENTTAYARWFSCYDLKEVFGPYDLILNCNSLLEMTKDFQDRYMRLIHQCLSDKGIFYSCNHESDMAGQFRVLDAINRHGGFRTCYRAPFIPRPGYIEEIFRKK